MPVEPQSTGPDFLLIHLFLLAQWNYKGAAPMRSPLYIDKEFKRAYVWGWRLHHGFVGCVLIVAGLILAAHDFKDRWQWVHREITELV